jgi:sugar phosphate permease
MSWHWAFFVVVPPGIILAIICLFMKDPPRGHSEVAHATPAEEQVKAAEFAGAVAPPKPTRKSTIDHYKTILGTPSYLLNTLGMTAMSFAVGGVAFWMPTYVLEVGYGLASGQVDVNPAAKAAYLEANLIFSGITVVAGLLSTLLGGWAGDKLRNRFSGSYFLVSGAAMLLGFFFFLGVLWMPFPAAWIMVFLSVFCLFFNTGPTNTILANVIHPSMRASAVALNIFLIHALGDAVSPAIIGKVAGRSDLKMGFLVVSAMILVSGVLWLWGARYLQRDTELAPKRLDV